MPYSPAQMFALVEDIERYPRIRALGDTARAVSSATSNEVVGRLEMHRAGVREKFTTRNVLNPPREIAHDTGQRAVQDAGRPLDVRRRSRDRGTKVGLSVRFEFANPCWRCCSRDPSRRTAGSWSNAFVARARAVYGATEAMFACRVVYALPDGRAIGRSSRCPRNQRREAVAHSGLMRRISGDSDAPLACAIFGQRRAADVPACDRAIGSRSCGRCSSIRRKAAARRQPRAVRARSALRSSLDQSSLGRSSAASVFAGSVGSVDARHLVGGIEEHDEMTALALSRADPS